jgi:small redox-active disulfide protein 2
MDIKILGTGCAKCQALERNTRDAVAELGISVNIEKVTDIQSIIKYDILMTPGLVIDGKVVVSGKLASKEEIKKLLTR